ncbi:MAG TPA: FAD-binding oxidoreductase [Candidatus Binatia bacterium]|jgi:glycine/D-amino acid oxidase-like deaminating enzyme
MGDFATRSFWLETAYTPGPPLEGDRSVDVAIVGGGFTGFWTAYFLKRNAPAMRIALIEREVVGYGASGRNGGFAMTLLNRGLNDMVQAFGESAAGDAHRAAAASVDGIGAFTREHRVECHYEKTGLVALASDPSQIPRIEAGYRQAERLGLAGFRFLDRATLQASVHSPTYECGVREETCAILDPARLVRGLRRVVSELGVEVFEATPVDEIRTESGRVSIRTPHGIVRADQAVLATNAYSVQFPQIHRYVIPIYSYIVLTEPLAPALWDAVGWKGREGLEDRRTYLHYYRPTNDGRILFGGEDAPYFYGSNVGPSHDRNPEVFARLQDDLRRTFPPLADVRFTHAWGGPVGLTVRFVPTFGTLEGGRVHYGFGYCGHGVGPTHLGGQILADLVAGRRTERTDLCFVRTTALPFPPEPLRWLGVTAARRALLRQDRERRTKDDPWIVRTMMRFGG